MNDARPAVALAIMFFIAGCAAGGAPDPGSSGEDHGSPAGGGDGGTQSNSFGSGPGGDAGTEQCSIATLGKPGVIGSSTIFEDWLDTKGGHVASALGDQVLTAALLAPFKMIVAENIDGNHAYAPGEVSALADWVKAGGGLMTLTGYDDPTEIDNTNRLLAPYAIRYDGEAILCGCFHSIPITGFAPHPITSGITRLGFDNGHPVLGDPATYASEQGFDVLKAADFGAGHVVAWGDEWITYDSEWSQHPDYQVQQFWQNIVDWFAPGAHCKVPTPPK